MRRSTTVFPQTGWPPGRPRHLVKLLIFGPGNGAPERSRTPNPQIRSLIVAGTWGYVAAAEVLVHSTSAALVSPRFVVVATWHYLPFLLARCYPGESPDAENEAYTGRCRTAESPSRGPSRILGYPAAGLRQSRLGAATGTGGAQNLADDVPGQR